MMSYCLTSLVSNYTMGESVWICKEVQAGMAQIGLLEDNERIARLCATMLQYSGYIVTIYDHPRQCLEALQPSEIVTDGLFSSPLSYVLPIDVLILDLHLPEITGIEVLRYLQSQPHTRSLPLIFCTASTTSDLVQALRIAPHASVVEKPFKMDVLISAVGHALSMQIR